MCVAADGKRWTFFKMKSQLNGVVVILLLSIVNLSARVNGFTPQNQNNALDDRLQLRKSHKIDDQLDRRRQHLDASDSTEDEEPLEVDQLPPNFLLIDYLDDGEIERRVSFNGITAKETSIANSGWAFISFCINILNTDFQASDFFFHVFTFIESATMSITEFNANNSAPLNGYRSIDLV